MTQVIADQINCEMTRDRGGLGPLIHPAEPLAYTKGRTTYFKVTDIPGDADRRRVNDLEREAIDASLRGADDATEALWTTAHNEWLRQGDVPRAARCISWLVLDLFNRREWARGNGWLVRGMHLLESLEDSPALGL